MHYSNDPGNKEYRQLLRRDQTPTERMLWRYLQRKQILGLKFRRQHGFGCYVMDFYCPTIRLCIEIDGEVHNDEKVKKKDEDRTTFLNSKGITVLRFSNEEIEKNCQQVAEQIKEFINSKNWGYRYDRRPPTP